MLPRGIERLSVAKTKQVKAANLKAGDRVCLGPPTLEAIVSNIWFDVHTVYVIWDNPSCHALIQSQFYSTATLFIYEKTQNEGNRQNPA
jgi:hypothetical protein